MEQADDQALEKAMKLVIDELISAVFHGDRERFSQTLEAYKQKYGLEDPHGRKLLNQTTFKGNILAFRCLSTDPDEINRQRRIRIEMWLDHLPLDLQLSLIMFEGLGNDFAQVPLDKIRWNDLFDIMDSPDPIKAFEDSDMRCPEKDVSENYNGFITQVRDDAMTIAREALHQGNYSAFEQLLTSARIDPNHIVSTLFVFYRHKHGRGHVYTELYHPIPFWASCVVAPTADDRFFEIIHRHGGPATPFQEGYGNDPGLMLALSDPIANINQVDSKIGSFLSKEALSWLEEVTTTNIAFWRHHSLERKIPIETAGNTPKPKM